MDQKAREISDEPPGARLARLGDVGQRERPDEHGDSHQPERALQSRGRVPEDGREPVQQVGEEQQKRDVEPLEEVLEETAGVLRNDLPLSEYDNQAERPEAERRPGGRPVALPPPLIDRGQRKRHVSHQADVPQNLDR